MKVRQVASTYRHPSSTDRITQIKNVVSAESENQNKQKQISRRSFKYFVRTIVKTFETSKKRSQAAANKSV